MLTTLAAYSSWDNAPQLPLSERGAQTDLIQILGIEGLGPVNADVNTSSYGSIDGESFVGAHVPKRNIVISVGLNPDWNNWSMEELRRLLYRYFMPKQFVRLVFQSNDDLPTVWISGYTESVEPTMFAKEGELQVSIVCPDPYFTSVDPIVVQGNAGTDPKTIVYNGTIETGYSLKVSQIVPPDATYITIRSGNPVTSKFQVYATISASKYMLMSSLSGLKNIQNIELNTGVITNLLSKVIEGSAWPTLKPGDNVVQVLTEIPSIVAKYELTYYERFGGL